MEGSMEGFSAQCRNCGRERAAPGDRFCGGCGQRFLSGRLTFRSLWGELLNRFFERGLLRTLVDAVRSPGGVIRRYVDGQRHRYVNPFSYLLVGVALSLLLFNLTRSETFDQQIRESFTPMVELLGWNEAQLDAAMALQNTMSENTSIYMLLLTIPFALLLRLFFPGAQVNLAEVSVFALFSFGHAFYLDVLAVVVQLFSDNLNLQIGLTVLVFNVAIGVSAWGFFGRRWWAVVRSLLAYWISYMAYSSLTAAALMIYVTKFAGVG